MRESLSQEAPFAAYETLFDAKTLRRAEQYAQSFGGLDATFGQGRRLFAHQRAGVALMLLKDRILCADETGLGKTYQAALAAVARQRVDGRRIIVLTTKSSKIMWQRVFEEIGASAHVCNWEHVPTITDELCHAPFVIVGDESQKACNEEAQRTQRFLALADHVYCRGVFLLSGTPMPNGRPVNLYPLLLAMRHPDVWHFDREERKRKKFRYLFKFCDRKKIQIGRNEWVWNNSGAKNLTILNRITILKPGAKDNDKRACIFARLKDECIDLPSKMRVLETVEVSPQAKKIFQNEVVRLWDEFEARVKEKVEAFRQEYTEAHPDETPAEINVAVREKQRRIRRAQAVVSLGILRRAGALAKIEHAFEMAKTILDNGGNKVVVFTSFTGVAKQLGALIEGLLGQGSVGYIDGDRDEAERQDVMDTFQLESSAMRVVISTAAGGEAITLTQARYMIIIDRPFTSGQVKQWEDRIHRLTTTGTVTIYWLQLPSELSPADIRIDTILQEKQVNIDAWQFGEVTAGMKFNAEDELHDQAEIILLETRRKIKAKAA